MPAIAKPPHSRQKRGRTPEALDPLPGEDGLRMPRRAIAIGAISFGNALVVLDGQIATVALPTIARDLHVDNSASVTIVTVYQLILVMLLLPFAGLGSQIGLKRLYQLGQVVFTIATALCFFAKSLPFLLVVRIFQATGAAATLSVSQALLRSIYPKNQLGRGLGLNAVVVSSGAALAPTLGGYVLAIAPWPWVFASAVPFAVLSLILGRSALPDPVVRKEPFDLLGAFLCAMTFGFIIGGLESAVHGSSPVVSAAIVLAGFFVGWLMVRREQGVVAPILPIDLLKQRVIALSVTGSFCAFIASMLLILSMSFRLQHEYGFAPAGAGTVIALWPLTMMVVAPLAGSLSDRVPAGLLGGVGMAIAVVGLLLTAFLPAEVHFLTVGWRMVLTGAGFGLFSSPNARLVIGSAPKNRIAAAGGLTSTTRLVGQTTGATVLAAMLHFEVGGRVPSLVGAGLALIAGICSVARLRPSIRNPARTETQDAQPAQQVR